MEFKNAPSEVNIEEGLRQQEYIIKLKQKVTSDNLLGNIREKIQTIHDSNYHITKIRISN
mgnify:CR=1 FL=1